MTINKKQIKSLLTINLAKFVIVVLIILAVSIFAIIGMMLLDINYSFNYIFQFILKKIGIANNYTAYYNIERKCAELELVAQLNNSAFNNNLLFFLYSLITTVICGIGGYILSSSLNAKQKIQDIIDEYKIKHELLENQYNSQVCYDIINIDLDSCSDVLLLCLVNEKRDDTKVKNIVKLRDCIFTFKNKIIELEDEYNKRNPFNTKDQIKILELKADRIKYSIENSYLKDNLKHGIQFLESSIEILKKWYEHASVEN